LIVSFISTYSNNRGEGADVGIAVGVEDVGIVEGKLVGSPLGLFVGEAVGEFVSPSLVGLLVTGARVGSPEGIEVGVVVG
jgi:hypothetical protein